MKFRIAIASMLLLMIGAYDTIAQNRPYAVSFKVSSLHGCNISGFNWDFFGGYGTGSYSTYQMDLGNPTAEIVFVGLDWGGPGSASSRFYLRVYSGCEPTALLMELDLSSLTECGRIEFDDPTSTYTGIVTWMPKLTLTADVPQCDKVNIAATCALGNYVWEISQTPSDPASWKVLRTTSPLGTWEDFGATSITVQDLVDQGMDPYATTSVRVKDSELNENLQWTPESNVNRASRTSDPVLIKLFEPGPTATLISSSDVICNGDPTGNATVQITGAIPEINVFRILCFNLDDQSKNFPIDNGVVSGANLIPGLAAGNWRFDVINNYNVSYYGPCSTAVNHTVIEPAPVTIGFNTPLYNGYAIQCNGGNTGETTAIGLGGRGEYKDFLWSTTATTDKITGLTAGTYTVSLKDKNNCPASNTVVLSQPAALQVSLSPSTGYNGYPVSCWNKNDGGVNSSVLGGITSLPYTYLWSTGATSNAISGRGTGTYSVAVTDVNGCTDSESITLGAPLPIDFTIQQIAGLSCAGDATASFEGTGVANTIGTVSYAWSSGETGSSIANKGAGTYALTVSDQQGCSTVKSMILNNPPAYTVSLAPLSNYNGSLIKCNGDSNGELDAIVRDANGVEVTAQNYRWTQNGTTIGESASLTSFDNLTEGNYKVIITYGSQCEAEATYFLSDPDPVTVTAAATSNYNGQPIKCHNGTDANLRATAGGGTPGVYTYNWNTGSTNSLLTGVGAGTYVVTVEDVNECTGNATVTLDNPEQVEASIVSVSDYSGYGITCNGLSNGSITAEGLGGTGVYSYAWSTGQTSPALTGLAAGSYTITVSDNNGCQDSFEQVITAPPALSFSVLNEKNISCFNGSDGAIALLASGGVGSYQYSRNSGTTWQPENTFSTLTPGSYTLTLRDGNGCTRTVPSTLTQPAEIDIVFTDIQPAFCSNPAGTARAVVTGGAGGYTYSWRNSNAATVVLDTDDVLAGVTGGIYTLIVHDNNACPMSENVPITSTDGAKSTYIATAAKCFDSSDGSAAITITAGDGPFVIEWPDGQNTLQGVNLKKDQYDVLITDGHHCTVIQTVDVPAPDAIELSVANSTIPTCNGSCDGQLTLEATGGVGVYVYEWNGKTGAAQTQLCAGIYPVVVTDANNCILNQDVELLQPEPLGISAVQSILPTCKNGCDGSLEVLATGGNGGYQYTWAAGGNTNIKTSACPGTYIVSVQDLKGCQGEGSIILNNAPALPLDLGGGITLCVGQSHTLDAGANWTSIKWGGSTGFESTQQRVTIKDVGSYWVEVLSHKGCIGQDTFLLETSYDLLQASFMIPHEAIAGDTVVMIDISWPLPETVEWNYPEAMREVLNLGDVLFGQFDETGTYEVGLTAHLGECIDRISKSITILEGEEGSEGGRLGYEKFVKTFTLHPNPTTGAFEVEVELLEESTVTLSVWNSPTGILIRQVQRNGQKLYRVSFDLRPLNSGTYVLRLDHAKGKEYIRFIVY
jgi:hypothetical protein